MPRGARSELALRDTQRQPGRPFGTRLVRETFRDLRLRGYEPSSVGELLTFLQNPLGDEQ